MSAADDTKGESSAQSERDDDAKAVSAAVVAWWPPPSDACNARFADPDKLTAIESEEHVVHECVPVAAAAKKKVVAQKPAAGKKRAPTKKTKKKKKARAASANDESLADESFGLNDDGTNSATGNGDDDDDDDDDVSEELSREALAKAIEADVKCVIEWISEREPEPYDAETMEKAVRMSTEKALRLRKRFAKGVFAKVSAKRDDKVARKEGEEGGGSDISEDSSGEVDGLTDRQQFTLELLFPDYLIDDEYFTHTVHKDDVVDEADNVRINNEEAQAEEDDIEETAHKLKTINAERRRAALERAAARNGGGGDALDEDDDGSIDDYEEDDDFCVQDENAHKFEAGEETTDELVDLKRKRDDDEAQRKTAAIDSQKHLKSAAKAQRLFFAKKKSSDSEESLSVVHSENLSDASAPRVREAARRERRIQGAAPAATTTTTKPVAAARAAIDVEPRIEPADYVHRRLLTPSAIGSVEEAAWLQNDDAMRTVALALISAALLSILQVDNPRLYSTHVEAASGLKVNFSEMVEKKGTSLETFCRGKDNWLTPKPNPDDAPERLRGVKGLRKIDVAFTQLRIDEAAALTKKRAADSCRHSFVGTQLVRNLVGDIGGELYTLQADDVKLLKKYAPDACRCAVTQRELCAGDTVACYVLASNLAETKSHYESALKAAADNGALGSAVDGAPFKEGDFDRVYSDLQTSALDLTATSLCMVVKRAGEGDEWHARDTTDAAVAGNSARAAAHNNLLYEGTPSTRLLFQAFFYFFLNTPIE